MGLSNYGMTFPTLPTQHTPMGCMKTKHKISYSEPAFLLTLCFVVTPYGYQLRIGVQDYRTKWFIWMNRSWGDRKVLTEFDYQILVWHFLFCLLNILPWGAWTTKHKISYSEPAFLSTLCFVVTPYGYQPRIGAQDCRKVLTEWDYQIMVWHFLLCLLNILPWRAWTTKHKMSYSELTFFLFIPTPPHTKCSQSE